MFIDGLKIKNISLPSPVKSLHAFRTRRKREENKNIVPELNLGNSSKLDFSTVECKMALLVCTITPSFSAFSRFALSFVRSTAWILDFPLAASFKCSSYHLERPAVNQLLGLSEIFFLSEKLLRQYTKEHQSAMPEPSSYIRFFYGQYTFKVLNEGILYVLSYLVALRIALSFLSFAVSSLVLST